MREITVFDLVKHLELDNFCDLIFGAVNDIGTQEGLCDYVLDKSTVSRLHVRIDETEEGYRVTDLNSTNGTFVNGRPLDANGTALIQPGDEIGVADLRFQLK